MKKLIVMAIAIVLASTAAFAVNSAAPDTAKTKGAKAKVQYTCTMHPDYVTDKPGKCPKCHMTLVKKVAGKKPVAKMTM